MECKPKAKQLMNDKKLKKEIFLSVLCWHVTNVINVIVDAGGWILN